MGQEPRLSIETLISRMCWWSTKKVAPNKLRYYTKEQYIIFIFQWRERSDNVWANWAINYSLIACITGVIGGSQVSFGTRAQSVKHVRRRERENNNYYIIPCYYLPLFPWSSSVSHTLHSWPKPARVPPIMPVMQANCPREPGARFSKVPIVNRHGKLSLFTLKIQVSIVLHLTW